MTSLAPTSRAYRLRARAALLALVTAVVTMAVAPATHAKAQSRGRLPSWHMVSSPSAATYRSLAAVSRQTAWVGSDDGTVLRTLDGGQS